MPVLAESPDDVKLEGKVLPLCKKNCYPVSFSVSAKGRRVGDASCLRGETNLSDRVF